MVRHPKKEQKDCNLLGPETARWGSGLPCEGVVAEKFVLSLESLSSLGFEERNVGCPGILVGCPGPLGVFKKVVHPGCRYFCQIDRLQIPLVVGSAIFQERKISPKTKFLGRISRGHPGVIRADIGPKLRSGNSKSWKNKHFGAAIHDPKARTSTTLRDFQKLRSEKLWAEFSFPNFAKFIDKGLCVSIESSDLLAKSPVRMTDLKILGTFWDAGNLRKSLYSEMR